LIIKVGAGRLCNLTAIRTRLYEPCPFLSPFPGKRYIIELVRASLQSHLSLVDFGFILGYVQYVVKKKISQVITQTGGFWKNAYLGGKNRV